MLPAEKSEHLSLYFILLEPRMLVQHFIRIRPTVKICQSGPTVFAIFRRIESRSSRSSTVCVSTVAVAPLMCCIKKANVFPT